MELGPNLRRIGNDIVAAYLVVTDEGITVVDAGLPGHWRDLLHELRGIGRSLDDIRGVVLTHGDSDHLGFAERLRRRGVPVFVHTADLERAKGGDKPKTPFGPAKAGPVARFIGYALLKGGLRTTYLTEATAVSDGDALPLPGSPVIVGMPGHSPGSIAVHAPLVDAVFVGDALTTRNVLTGRTGLSPAPFTDEPDLAQASLERLAGLRASWVLPGHGAPWRGDPGEVAGAVAQA